MASLATGRDFPRSQTIILTVNIITTIISSSSSRSRANILQVRDANKRFIRYLLFWEFLFVILFIM